MDKYTKKLIFLTGMLLLLGCGKDTTISYTDPSCKVTEGVNGTLLQCPNGSQALIAPNGTQYNIVTIIDPCGDAPGIYDEVLLKLANGQIVASFSQNVNGDYTRFALIPQGTYMTTDGSNCRFNVSSTGEVSW